MTADQRPQTPVRRPATDGLLCCRKSDLAALRACALTIPMTDGHRSCRALCNCNIRKLYFSPFFKFLLPFTKCLNVKCNNDYSVQNYESLRAHSTNGRRVTKRDKTVRTEKRCDLRRQQKMERGAPVTCDGRLFHRGAVATGNALSPTVDRRVYVKRPETLMRQNIVSSGFRVYWST